jgi:hypothetical protein
MRFTIFMMLAALGAAMWFQPAVATALPRADAPSAAYARDHASPAPSARQHRQVQQAALAPPFPAHPVAPAQPLQPTRAISVPFGFDPPLVLSSTGERISVIGHGGCTAGQTVTIAVTLTQSLTGAQAPGQTEETCTGELQYWTLDVSTQGSSPFAATEVAQACGLATTRDNGSVTDSLEWCRAVDLVLRSYLPLIQ